MTLSDLNQSTPNSAVSPAETEIDHPYNVRNFWYPVIFLQDLPNHRPYGFSIYDESFVLFFTTENQLECLSDRCPHRAAKLSDGQVIDGKIECLYHGWQFGTGGECLLIPQIQEGGKIPKNACAQSFAVAVRQQLVWVWLGEKHAANLDEIPALEVLEEPGVISSDYMVELPYDRT